MKQILTGILIGTCIFASAQKHPRRGGDRFGHRANKDTLVVEIQPELNPYDRNHCLWPLPDYRAIYCRTELVSAYGERNNIAELSIDPSLSEQKKPDKSLPDLSRYTNGIITSPKEYKPLKQYLNLEIDWKREKVAFYTISASYKHGILDSDSRLMGVSISADGKTLCLGYRSTFYGVCQGIAQLPEWYSFEIATYAIVIPNTVEKITNSWCHSGPDCSNIP